MARVAKAKTTIQLLPTRRKPGRPVATAAKAAKRSSKLAAPAGEAVQSRKQGRRAKVALSPAFSKSAKITRSAQRAPAEAPAPKASKGELRAQVERLEQLVASHRAKSREANKAAKAAAARISELEAQVARLEKRVAAAPTSATEAKPGKRPRAKRWVRDIDPGDAVPPGVVVQEPALLDAEAETALENLEEHLGRD